MSESNGNRRLTAADIFAAQDLRTETVDVPEWGGSIAVRTMTAKEAEDFGETPKKDSLLRLVELCTVGPEGERLFTHEDLARLAEKSWVVILRVHLKAAELNGLTPDAQAIIKNA